MLVWYLTRNSGYHITPDVRALVLVHCHCWAFFGNFLWQPKSLLVSSKWRAKRKHYKVLCICVLGKDKIGITCSCWVSIPNQIKQHELHLLEDGTGHWARNRRLSLINLAQLIGLLIIIDNLSTWLIDLVIWCSARKVVWGVSTFPVGVISGFQERFDITAICSSQ